MNKLDAQRQKEIQQAEELLFAGPQALPDRLVKVALEEVAHYVTGATDNSRDFQNFLLDLSVKLARSRSASHVFA